MGWFSIGPFCVQVAHEELWHQSTGVYLLWETIGQNMTDPSLQTNLLLTFDSAIGKAAVAQLLVSSLPQSAAAFIDSWNYIDIFLVSAYPSDYFDWVARPWQWCRDGGGAQWHQRLICTVCGCEEMGTSMPMDTSMQILDIVQSCAEACDGDYGLHPETAVHALSALRGSQLHFEWKTERQWRTLLWHACPELIRL